MTRGTKIAGLLVGLLVASLLVYLRDPPWLIDLTQGLGAWEQDRGGHRFRWMSGRASFFIPAETQLVRIPLRALFLTDDRRPFIVRIDVNDRPASIVALVDERWTDTAVKIAGVGRRRHVARVDLHVNRTWGPFSRGIQVGVVTVEPPGSQ